MNFRSSSSAKTFLLLCLPLAILVIPRLWHLMTLPLSQQEMQKALVGKWTLIGNDPNLVDYRIYEFSADGRYRDKFRIYQLVDLSNSMWISGCNEGRYQITSDNEFMTEAEVAALNMNWNRTVVQIGHDCFRRETP